MKTLRKICSAIVILALCLGMFPTTTLAITDTGFSYSDTEDSSFTTTRTYTGGSGDSITYSNTDFNVTYVVFDITDSLKVTNSVSISSMAVASVTVSAGDLLIGGDFNVTSSTLIKIQNGYVEADNIIASTNVSSGNLGIIINGGIVKANSISVHNTNGSATGTQNLTINGDAVVFVEEAMTNTAGINTDKGVEYTKGVVFTGNTGTVYGSVTLPDGVTIPDGYTLTIPSGASLTVPSGKTLTNEGTINVSGGTFTNNGTIEDYGTINGTVGGTTPQRPATVTMDNVSATYGGSVTLTANVKDSNGTAATSGTVNFYQGTDTSSTPLNSTPANVSNGTATYELELTGTNWKPSDSPYTITAVYSGGTDLLSGSGSGILSVSKATPTATPVGPISSSSRSETSITLNTVSDGNTGTYGEIQYGYTTGSETTPSNWQNNTVFTNLNPGTDYTFYTRYAGNDYYNPSSHSSSGLPVTTPPKITTSSLPTGYVGVPYHAQLQATVASSKEITWSLGPSATLPDGLQLNSDGTITGTPTAAVIGKNVEIMATISGGQIDTNPVWNTVVFYITINAGTPTFTANTYNGDNQTSTFTYGDTITVGGTIAASSQAPGNGINAITEPAQNQVGLYLGDNQLATANMENDGSFALTYDTAGQGIPIGDDQTLTVKYGGSTDLNSGETTVAITLNKKPVTATFTGSTTKIYDETTDVPSDLTVALSKGDVVGSDDVTVLADSITYDNANVGENKTITASGITLSGGDADWYSLSNETVTTTGSITKQAQDAPAEGDGYTIDYGAETITVTDDTYELSTDSTATSGSATLDVTPGTNVYIRFKETDTQEASAWTTVTIPSRPAAPQNVRGGTNSITNVDSTMAYSADGETWTAITGERVTNLRAGTYLVRIAATDDSFASERASVTVRDYVAPPTTPSEPEKPSGPSTGDSDGWESILDEILDAEDGDTITIDMNGETEVPGEIFEAVADRNVTVIFEMGEDVSWTVNGNDVPTDTSFDTIDLGVSMNTDGIPVDVINAVTGEATSVQITLAHDGDFGFALTLSAPLGEENAGYWANLYHYDEDAEAMDFETAALIDDDGTANLRMTHASQYAIVIDDHPHETVLPFTDVNANDWFYDPVVWAYDNGFMTGTSATTFEPNTSTTRAMIVAILNRLEDGPTADSGTFTDVHDGDWYAEAVNWAASVGIVAGFEDGTFRPNAPITREQMAAILYNYAQWKGIDVSNRADLSRYSDQPSPWATDVMQWAVAEGLISGTSATTLDPQGHATRTQVAAIFQRFLSA